MKEKNVISKKISAITMALSFVVPVIIMALAYYNTDVYPGGANTILIFDLKEQFLPLYASLRYLGKGDSSVLYTFFGALGNNSLPEYSWIIFDPFAWFTVLFPLEKLPDALYYITLIKIGLCGLCFSIFMFLRKDKEKHPAFIFLFSCCYALMSFNIMYSMVIPWFNVIALTPLILLGVERLAEGKRSPIYLIFLTLSLYFHFQMAYIVGIFSAIYLIYCMIERKEKRPVIFGRFVLYSVLSLGLYAPVFLPVAKNVLGARLQADNVSGGKLFYYPIWKVLNQFLPGRYHSLLAGGLPSLFCGTLTLVLFLVSLIIMRKNKAKLIATIAIVAFYLFCFCFAPFNRVWHGFSEPIGFPVRYSYTLCLFLILIAYEAIPFVLENIAKLSSIKGIICPALIAFGMVELYFNVSMIMSMHNMGTVYASSLGYESDISWVGEALDNIDDDDFYRVSGGKKYYCVSESQLFGYNGINFFSSFYNKDFLNFMGTLGYSQKNHVLLGIGGTPVSDSIFGVRYRVCWEKETSLSDIIYNKWPYAVHYNEDALSLGYIIKGDNISELPFSEMVDESDIGNAFAYQNIMMSDISGISEPVFAEIPYEITEIPDEDNARHVKVEFTTERDGRVWAFFGRASEEERKKHEKPGANGAHAFTTVNGEDISSLCEYISTECIYLGNFKAGETVTLEGGSEMYFLDPWIVAINEDAFSKSTNIIRENELDITSHGDGRIIGTITTQNDDSMMMLTIPYIDGYKIRLDGKRVDYSDYKNALVIVPIEKGGKHSVEISYFPTELLFGMIVASFTILFMFLYYHTMASKQSEKTK